MIVLKRKIPASNASDTAELRPRGSVFLSGATRCVTARFAVPPSACCHSQSAIGQALQRDERS